MTYETFDHTADLGLRIRAADLPSLFADAACGLFATIVADLATIRCSHERTFRVTGDPEQHADDLLFDWLSELLYAFESELLLLARFEVELSGEGLIGRAFGEPFDPARHRLEHEVKAITYHGLLVERTADGWLAEVIVDI